jgi:hypothetical protein
MDEVPPRRVLHDFEDDSLDAGGDLVGDAHTLPMSPQQKAAVRRKRERLRKLGGFGFQAPHEE